MHSKIGQDFPLHRKQRSRGHCVDLHLLCSYYLSGEIAQMAVVGKKDHLEVLAYFGK